MSMKRHFLNYMHTCMCVVFALFTVFSMQACSEDDEEEDDYIELPGGGNHDDGDDDGGDDFAAAPLRGKRPEPPL